MSKEDAFKAAMLVCQQKIPHAIISSSVTMTRGIWEALDIQGISPGKDIQVLTLGEESWNKSDQLPGVTHSSRSAFTMGTSVADLLIGNIAKPFSFEKKNLSFTDDIIYTKLNIPPRTERKSSVISVSGRKTLRVLHYEIPSTNSIKLVSRCFSNQYDVDTVSYTHLDVYKRQDEEFIPMVEQTLSKYKVDPKHIVLELTESYFVTNMGALRETFRRLRDCNIKIAMDDFGTGYSSLGMLAQSPADIVKIDRLFITDIAEMENAFNRNFIGSVIKLCHSVGIAVCVEGVERTEELDAVCDMEADCIQAVSYTHLSECQ